MHDDALRWLDRTLGRWLCGLLGRFLSAPFLSAPLDAFPETPSRQVLFCLLAEGGSIVLATPSLRLLEQAGFTPWFLTFQRNAGVLAMLECVPRERVLLLDETSPWRLLRSVWLLRRRVRTAGIDLFIDGELSAYFTALLGVWLACPRRFAFADSPPSSRHRLYTRLVPFSETSHVADNYLRLAAVAASLEPPSRPARLSPVSTAAASRLRVRQRLATLGVDGRLVLVNANASERLPQRRWPADSFVALIEQLLAIRPDVTVLLIGAPEDGALTSAIASAVAKSRCRDVAGLFAIEELPALFESSQLLISNDSGPAHFAAACALPVVTLFGPETPQRFSPLGAGTVLYAGLSCSPCIQRNNQRTSDCPDNRCMKAIAVESVLAVVLDWLNGMPHRTRSPVSCLP